MRRPVTAALLAAALSVPALLAGQAAAPKAPSPFTAIEVREELRITPQQLAQITEARDSLRAAHRLHCAPMHASTPTEAEEERHHAEMAAINARWETQARAALTAEQLRRLAALRPPPAQPAGHARPEGSGAAREEHRGHHPR